MNSRFPIIDGRKVYQGFKDDQRPATLENLNETIQVLDYLEQELAKQISYYQSEKRRMCKCIDILKEEDAGNTNSAHVEKKSKPKYLNSSWYSV